MMRMMQSKTFRKCVAISVMKLLQCNISHRSRSYNQKEGIHRNHKDATIGIYAKPPPRIHHTRTKERYGPCDDPHAASLFRLEGTRYRTSAFRGGARYAGTGTT